MSVELLVLRLLHVVGGIFWVGGGLYSTIFIMPALATAGPAAAPIFAEMQRRKLFTVLPLVALTTMLSGLRLMWIVSGGFTASYFATGPGLTFAIGGAASIIGFLVAMFVSRPASMKLGPLAAQLPSLSGEAKASAERRVASLKSQASVGTAAAVLLLTVAAVAMSIARYL